MVSVRHPVVIVQDHYRRPAHHHRHQQCSVIVLNVYILRYCDTYTQDDATMNMMAVKYVPARERFRDTAGGKEYIRYNLMLILCYL